MPLGYLIKHININKVKQSTYGARRAAYVCGPLLARVAVARVGVEVGPRRFELRTSAV